MKAPTEYFPKPHQTRLIQRNLIVVELLSITMLVYWHSSLMKKKRLASAVKRSRDIQKSIDGSSDDNLASASKFLCWYHLMNLGFTRSKNSFNLFKTRASQAFQSLTSSYSMEHTQTDHASFGMNGLFVVAPLRYSHDSCSGKFQSFR
jgi:hypothetical protein